MSSTAYDEVLDFITSTPSLEQIVNFVHSPKTVERVNYLLQCVDDETITDAEREELREFSRAALSFILITACSTIIEQ